MSVEYDALKKIVDRLGSRIFGPDYRNLSEAEQTFRLVWATSGDIDNGGFFQHLGNADATILDAPAAFERIEAPKKASAIRTILELAGPGVDWASQADKDALAQRLDEDVVDHCDNLFMHGSEDVDPLLLRYVRNHASAFEIVN